MNDEPVTGDPPAPADGSTSTQSEDLNTDSPGDGQTTRREATATERTTTVERTATNDGDSG